MLSQFNLCSFHEIFSCLPEKRCIADNRNAFKYCLPVASFTKPIGLSKQPPGS